MAGATVAGANVRLPKIMKSNFDETLDEIGRYVIFILLLLVVHPIALAPLFHILDTG